MLAASCTSPQEALDLDAIEHDEEASPRYAGYARTPEQPPADGTEPPVGAKDVAPTQEHYDGLPQPPGRVRRRDWDVMTNLVDTLLEYDPEREPCDNPPPELPAVSADGSVLALGLTAYGARGRDYTIRLYATETGALLNRKRLPRIAETGRMTRERACATAAEVADWLAPGEFEPMQEGVRHGDGMPERVDPWMVVVSDGARREKDGTYDVLVVPRSAAKGPNLDAHPASGSWGGDITAWLSEDVAVLVEYYIGC